MISLARFRADMTAFADDDVYPDEALTYWLGIAAIMLNTKRFGFSAADPWPASPETTALKQYDFATEQFVAHNLAIEKMAANQAAAPGGVPGAVSGVVQSSSVDKVSVSYSADAGLEPDAGHWNLTIYGRRFIRLLRMAGAGPYQVGAPC